LSHGELLQDKGGANIQERGEVPGETQVAPDNLEAVSEAANDSEDQCAVADRLAKVA
jgi:hypothetical protein